MTTALAIVQTACNELGLEPPDSLTTSSTPDTRQLLALANREGQELFQTHQWTALQTEHIVNITDSITTTGDLTASSAIITNIPTTAGITANYWAVIGDDVQISARVVEVIDGTSVRMDEPATGTQVGASLVFAQDTYAVPSDFSWFLNRTMWDRTNRWELIGPISPQMDQWQRSGVVTTGPRRRWRQIGLPLTNWRIWPPPTAGNDYPGTLVFEYVSKNWVLSAAGAGKTAFTADDDTSVVDPQAIILGIKWRFWQVKGMAYLAMQREYVDYVSRIAARDGGAPDLYLGRRSERSLLLGPYNIQDGNFPSS